MTRSISFNSARARYVHRYTMDHKPAWAGEAAPDGKRYAPQYASDREWYESTIFPGETRNGIAVSKREKHCISLGQTWPLGEWLPTKEGE